MKTILTENLQNTQRLIPHTLVTRLVTVKTYRNNISKSFICRRYKVSKASLIRFEQYDWNKGSLMDKSLIPHSKYQNKHTEKGFIKFKYLKDCKLNYLIYSKVK